MPSLAGECIADRRIARMVAVLYVLFFLSGAAALVYEVVWVRSMTLIFGGSHLAVATVLSVFMGGLALGSYVVGRYADRSRRLFFLYGLLEVGIGVSAAVSVLLIEIYPRAYVLLAHGHEADRLYVSSIRVLFAAVAMIAPTTLMGGTLPVLSRLLAPRPDRLGRHLSFLYSFNTLGAVAGTLAAGFFLLPELGASATFALAIGTNLAIGALAISLERRGWSAALETQSEAAVAASRTSAVEEHLGIAPSRLVLWGIAISGFCALGYEVLWTRVLSMVIGTSVYGFTIMLAAFLTGIALGSQAFRALERLVGASGPVVRRLMIGFAAAQIAIGVTALAVTRSIRDLPEHTVRLQELLLTATLSEFEARQSVSFLVAFSYMLVPTFFMGLAFPLAGRIQAMRGPEIGAVIGRVAAYNTLGAILGAGVTGFGLTYLFGVERSLQLLSAMNIGAGLWLAAAVRSRPAYRHAAALATLAVLIALAVWPDWGRIWDAKYFAIYRNNQRDAFSTPEKIRDAIENTDVLFYHEGTNETISVIRPKGGDQAVLVNGKVVASSMRRDVQCQYTLGHLPMLLHPNPRKVWVLGMGTAMTLGATSVHPSVEDLTVVEIEPEVVPAARTFAELNHDVLDDPRLRIIYNDGRNHLMTTEETYDVITADPIHPWTRGSAYLYTTEYYQVAARRLRPGGIMCQWVPIYELRPGDLQTIVRTFGESFSYMMLWLTHYDAELIGSNSPITIDEAALARRIAHPAIAADLASIEMGSAADFLSYFVMGTEGLRAFSRDARVNTDDNLRLEFSAPESIGLGHLTGANVQALTRYRESVLPYLTALPDPDEEVRRTERWNRNSSIARIHDRAHALLLWSEEDSEEFGKLLAALERFYPDYAPGRFVRAELEKERAARPQLLRSAGFTVTTDSGAPRVVEISALRMRIGPRRGVVVFVDNAAREIYGQLYVDAAGDRLDAILRGFADRVFDDLQAAYRRDTERLAGGTAQANRFLPSAKDLIARRVREHSAAAQP